jgi:hypothetical protein
MRTRKTFKGTMARTANIKASKICAELETSFGRQQQARHNKNNIIIINIIII